MPDNFLRQSALAHLGLDSRAKESRGVAGIAMKEVPFRAIVNLRGKPGDQAFLAATEKTLGFALPLEPNTVSAKDGLTALWLSPEEWWILAEDDGPALANRLLSGLAGLHAAVTDVSESRTCIHVTGPLARELLAKGTPLDLHPSVLEVGHCAGTHVSKAMVVLHHVSESEADGPAYDLYVLRSFSDYLWRWLEDAAREYGLEVVA